MGAITTSGAFAQTNTCGTSLPAGATCEVIVTFTPTAPGTLTGSLTINDGDPTSPQTVSSTGVGSGVPAVELSATSLNFGNQQVGTSSAPQKLTLTNNGSASLSMTAITVAGASFTATNTCGTSVPAGKSCTISVTFAPLGPGLKTGTIYITDSANPPNQTVSLSGTGTQPVVTLSPTSVAFGNQEVNTSSAPQKVTLTNTGGNLTMTSITVAGASFTETNNCGSSIPVGGSCTISVTFAPPGPASKMPFGGDARARRPHRCCDTPLIGRRQLGANAGRDGSPKLVPVAIAFSDPHRFARIWGNTSLVSSKAVIRRKSQRAREGQSR
jgi:hypothetical protein